MEFGLSGSIQLASRSATSSQARRRPGFRPVADKFELSQHVEVARTCSQIGLRPACADQLASWSQTDLHEPVCDLLASWVAPDRPNSITLFSSLAGRRSAHKLVRELDSVMEFGLY